MPPINEWLSSVQVGDDRLMAAILDGIRVLDFTQVLSGPTVTRYLAEMGADVVKVEVPPDGDITRNSVTRRDGRSGYFVTVNRGKRSICVDLKDDRAVELLLSLIDGFDVVVENFSPGTIDRLGLGWDVLTARNVRLIMCSISGFGETGPLGRLPGYDGAAAAYAGLSSLNGELGGEPLAPPSPMGDVLTGMNGVTGILGALLWRERTGRGQRVTTSVIESYLQTHDTGLQSYSVSRGEIVQTRNGRFHPLVCPYGIFRAGDGHVFIAAAADRHWVDLCTAMDRADLLDPEHRWNDRAIRESEPEAVNQLVEAWMISLPTRDAALEILQRHRVPCGPVLGVDEVVEHPDLRQAGFVRTVTDPILGTIDVPGFPIHFSEAEAGFDYEAALLGEHNVEVLTSPAGGADRLAALVKDGVVTAAPTGRPSNQARRIEPKETPMR